jgi:hypothetical protein
MNIIVTTFQPTLQSFIFKSIDCGFNHHTGEYIAAEISSVIEEWGKEKCLGLIMAYIGSRSTPLAVL